MGRIVVIVFVVSKISISFISCFSAVGKRVINVIRRQRKLRLLINDYLKKKAYALMTV